MTSATIHTVKSKLLSEGLHREASGALWEARRHLDDALKSDHDFKTEVHKARDKINDAVMLMQEKDAQSPKAVTIELEELNAEVSRLAAQREKTAAALMAAEAALEPLRDNDRRAAGDELRARARLNAWWRKNRAEYESANTKLSGGGADEQRQQTERTPRRPLE